MKMNSREDKKMLRGVIQNAKVEMRRTSLRVFMANQGAI